MGKLFGYARVSTDGQELEPQINALKHDGVHPSDIFVEKISSRIKNREQLNMVLSKLEAGDLLVVYKLDRLGRSLHELIKLVGIIEEKGANLKILSGSMIINTSNAQDKFFFNIMALFSEYERDVIRERTILGLNEAKSNNVKLGRPVSLSEKQVSGLLDKRNRGWSITEVCVHYNISRATYYRHIKNLNEA